MPEDEPEWITLIQAAEVIGCSPATVLTMTKDGRLAQRHVPRMYPSIEAESARRVAQEWRQQRKARQRAAQARLEREGRQGPPRDGDVWLDTATTALVLGVSPSLVKLWAARGRIRSTLRGRRRWFRRSDVEMRAAARAFRRP